MSEETKTEATREVMNRTKKIQVFNLPCSPDCAGNGPFCSSTEQRTIEEAKDGTRGVRVVQKHIAGSFTFLAGEKKAVPLQVLAAPDVKRAIDRGDLRLL